MDVSLHLLVFLLALVFVCPEQTVLKAANRALHDKEKETVQAFKKNIIGSVVDYSTRTGKEETVAMEMAIEDFCNHTNRCPILLRVRNSQGKAAQATLAARYLINKKKVKAILGPRSWEEASSVAEVGNKYNIPIVSFADSSPPWATKRWPFLIQASPSRNKQMKAVSQIVQSWGWRRVSVIYEDVDSAANGITSHLYDALQEVGAQISRLIALPSFADGSLLSEELRKLKREQCRVFVVHTSYLPLAARLFNKATEMKMMGKGYVWITTDALTSLVHYLNFSTISSMQGVIGVRSYYYDEGLKYQDFYKRFQDKFGLRYPEEKSHEPSNFAVEAYDATWTVALAMEKGNINQQQFLEKLRKTDYYGLSGKIQFAEGRLAPMNVFQLLNVIGRSYRELGFWSDGVGFSEAISEAETAKNINGSISMDILGQIFWPGGPPSTPRGWDNPTDTNPLRIGVPNNSMTNRYVKVDYDSSANSYSFSGFSVDVFKETIKHLPYFLPYDFVPFNGTYDALVEQVRLKDFDAAVGDIAIVSKRCKNADFTHPHTESGLVLIVPIQSQSNKAWLFLKPFTKEMWLLTASINVYNGFVIWMIERTYCELKGSALNQIGKSMWLGFASLFSLTGERLHSNLSRMATVVWLFVALIISQSYTASFTSMLTVSRLKPTVSDIETLKISNAPIGYSYRSFVRSYLLDVLHVHPNNMRNFSTPEEIAEALKSGKIAAILLEIPAAKLFLAKYCKSFMTAGPTYIFGGYGYAFPKGSPILPDIDEALLKVFESGQLKELEDNLTASEKCVDTQSDNETLSLGANSFSVLFILTGGTSTAALAIYVIHSRWKAENNSMLGHKGIWMLMLIVLKHWRNQKNKLSRKVSDAESPRNSPTHHTPGSDFEYSA